MVICKPHTFHVASAFIYSEASHGHNQEWLAYAREHANA